MIFDHVQIKVSDLKKSKDFYQAVLGILGYGIVFEEENSVVGFGNNPHDMFEISEASSERPLSRAVHVAFVAKSEEDVRKFHSIALEYGGKDNGKPGLRPEYEEGYFAAFVLDPDGHNIEAVYKDPEKN